MVQKKGAGPTYPSTHVAAFFRQPFVGIQPGFTGSPGIARTQQYQHNPNLYAPGLSTSGGNL